MTEGLTGWETTRLSNHFILLDFLADHEVYPQPGRRIRQRLPFDENWSEEHDALARDACDELLEPLMTDKRIGPISVADAFWPTVFTSGHHQADASRPNKHRWAGGEATVDIAFYRLVDEGRREQDLRKAVLDITTIDGWRDRVIRYPETEFVCVTFKRESAQKRRHYLPGTVRHLLAQHVRVGRYCNLLDFCRSGRAVEEGIDLVPVNAESRERA